MENPKTSSNTNVIYFIKIFMVITFQVLDLVINSWCEFKNVHDGTSLSQSRRMNLVLFTIQILMQLSCFTLVILLMCDTLPFRVGLVHIFLKRFGYMIITLGIYLFLTVLVGGIRLSSLSGGKSMIDLWNTGHYSFFSFCQKLGEFISFKVSIQVGPSNHNFYSFLLYSSYATVAPFHYAFMIKSSIELGMSEYFTKDISWLNVKD
jgi:hypothetical protein